MLSLYQFLRESISRNGERTFLFFGEERISYAEFGRMVASLAGLLDSLGVRRGSRVALMLPNSPHYLAMWFALASLGAVMVAINTQLKGDSLRHILRLTEPHMVFVDDRFLRQIEDVKESGAPSEIYRHLPESALTCRVVDRRTEREIPQPESYAIEDRACWKDPLIITFTSGTTGMPKGVVNSHNAYIVAGEDMARICRITPDDRIYTFLPLYHANPQVYCVMACMAAGASIALAERFSASGFWRDVKKHRATLFSYVGAVLPILLKQPVTAEEKEHTLRACFGGGAPEPVFRSVEERFGIEVLELYGMSETGAFNTINRPGRTRCGTVGIVRPGFDVRIFDERDNELPPGEVGEFVIRPLKPYIMFDGYYNQPGSTLECLRNLWFHTGDLGWVDEEGFFHFVSRKKEAIRRGGENVAPLEIEKVLDDHPAVLESAVIGVPSEIMGQEIKAFVVLKDGHSASFDDLVEWCDERLARFMIPRYWEFVDELPKTASQKVQKSALIKRPFGRCWDARQKKWVEEPQD